MALISKTGIVDAGLIQAEHVTRAIDALSGGSTDTVVATGSFSGSLTGIASFAVSSSTSVSSSFASTSSFAISSSFSATASYALNAGDSGLTTTITFFHNEVIDTVNDRISYIGGFCSTPQASATRIGITSPISGTIVSGSIVSYASSPDNASINASLSTNGGTSYTDIATMDLSQFIDKETFPLNIPISVNDTLNIRLTEVNDSSATWNINVLLIVKED
jgi:hypothetical protein